MNVNPGVDGLKNEFESLGILTQLIGPPKRIHNSSDVDSQPGDLPKGQKEANRFKEMYMAKTDQLDKMRAHHESLSRAVARGKLPMKGMNADKMREILGSHPDFRNEKNRIERMLTEEHGHIAYFLPKYHCKLNPIERVWAQAKRYSKAYCNYSIVSPCKNVGICATRKY